MSVEYHCSRKRSELEIKILHWQSYVVPLHNLLAQLVPTSRLLSWFCPSEEKCDCLMREQLPLSVKPGGPLQESVTSVSCGLITRILHS